MMGLTYALIGAATLATMLWLGQRRGIIAGILGGAMAFVLTWGIASIGWLFWFANA